MKLTREDIERADSLLHKINIVGPDNQYAKAYKGAISSFGAAIVYSGLDAAVKFYARKQAAASVDKKKILQVIEEFTGCRSIENIASLQVKDVERALVAMKIALRFYKEDDRDGEVGMLGGNGVELTSMKEESVFNQTKWSNVEKFLEEEKISNLRWYFFERYYSKDIDKDVNVRVHKRVNGKEWDFEESLSAMQYIRMNNSIKAYELTKELCEKSVYNSLNSLNGYTCFDLSTTYPGALLGSGLPHGVGEKGEIKIGFQFDYTSGLPYIPGSSVKGVLKSMFKDSANIYLLDKLSEILQSDVKLSTEELKKIREDIFENSNIVFLDSEIVLPNGVDKMRIIGDDFITPHTEPLKDPVPIQFLKILPNVVFRFSFLIKGKINCGKKEMSNDNLLKLFKSILSDTGVGAKTNIGYGRLVEVEKGK